MGTSSVRFSNCEVPLYKLRTGTVVAWDALGHTAHGNIGSICTLHNGEIIITIAVGKGHINLSPEELTWLEPY
jgi:hypothetical protein